MLFLVDPALRQPLHRPLAAKHPLKTAACINYRCGGHPNLQCQVQRINVQCQRARWTIWKLCSSRDSHFCSEMSDLQVRIRLNLQGGDSWVVKNLIALLALATVPTIWPIWPLLFSPQYQCHQSLSQARDNTLGLYMSEI